MSEDLYRFPMTKYDHMNDKWAIGAQVDKVLEEADEVWSANHCNEGFDRVAEEAWDTIHASEGVLRRLEDRGVDVEERRQFVIAKNRERGLYAQVEESE